VFDRSTARHFGTVSFTIEEMFSNDGEIIKTAFKMDKNKSNKSANNVQVEFHGIKVA